MFQVELIGLEITILPIVIKECAAYLNNGTTTRVTVILCERRDAHIAWKGRPCAATYIVVLLVVAVVVADHGLGLAAARPLLAAAVVLPQLDLNAHRLGLGKHRGGHHEF